ncbi:MAG: endonuclease V [Nitrososphaerota archaeon]
MSSAHLVEFFTEVQKRLSWLIRVSPLDPREVELLCGLDISYRGCEGAAAAVTWSTRTRSITETATYRGSVILPYIPGLLYSREAPLMLAALKILETKPSLLLIDGHGLAHPRRAGLASIMGLLAETPSIGVAKSLLYGTVRAEDGVEYLEADGEVVGIVLKSARGRKLYVSVGYRVDVQSILGLVSLLGEDLAQPVREAHRLSKAALRV